MPEILTRKQCLALGLNQYFTGRACKHGHVSERYLKGGCIECIRLRDRRKFMNCRTCGSPINRYRAICFCSEVCAKIMKKQNDAMRIKTPAQKQHVRRHSSLRYRENREKHRIYAQNRHRRLLNDTEYVSSRKRSSLLLRKKRKAALAALKQLGITVETPKGFAAKSEGRYIAAFRALRALGIQF